ncbi:MAG: VIT1/CCC1 transporter family protein [Candidatus Omnitrophica bacterium]|nr:VIT1/CCC1 transporter family protein [Candidatus Omnitrophota bacterium]
MTPDQFAANEYRDYISYRELAKIETVPAFKRILEELVQHELEDYRFWLPLSSQKRHRVGPLQIACLKLMRKLLGLTFTAKFLELHERDAVRNYALLLESAEPKVKARLQEIIAHERQHERGLIQQIKEEHVKFLSSIVLGVNDGLVELTGALVGFAFALRHSALAGLFGVVTGIAASLSMAASAYMQARHEEGRDPKKAALYTGLAYLTVVVLLVLPFFAFARVGAALGAMFGVILGLIAGLSFYSSVLFERDFKRQFREMLLFSLGVSGIAFLLGSAARALMGVLKVPLG